MVKRHDERGDEGDANFFWLHLPPYSMDILIYTDNKSVEEIAQEMKKYIDKA